MLIQPKSSEQQEIITTQRPGISKIISSFRDPVSGLTHLGGAVLSVLALIMLAVKAMHHDNMIAFISLIIFGVSLILLYTASTVYHLCSISEKGIMILRKIDHMMIFILIAGTYTPICVIALQGALGISLLITIWSLALIGILLKLFWFKAPRWLSTLFYILMGWLCVGALVPIYRTISLPGTIGLVLGGLLYTLGASIYATRWPRITSRYFGFHEIFHIFVLLGSFSHFWTIFNYVVPI